MRGKPITFPNSHELRIRGRGRIPHWELDNATYSVTFRLADALPRHVVEALKAERLLIERMVTGGRPPSAVEADQISSMFFLRLDEHLDASYGECFLRRPAIAELVTGALRFFDRDRYRLLAWCVMPNHVHVVFVLMRGRDLAKVLHSWKSYTGTQANALLEREGTFWQREYHDRMIRDSSELERQINYVIQNPEKAGFKDWPYVWSLREEEW